MNPLDLRDIHVPGDSLWWPLAPGWWILILSFIAFTIGIRWMVKRYRRRSLYRSCQAQFAQLRSDIKKGQIDKNPAAEISIFLRRVLISYQGRDNGASLYGEDWISAVGSLDTHSVFNEQHMEFLAYAQYKKDATIDVNELLEKTGQWVSQLPKEMERASV